MKVASSQAPLPLHAMNRLAEQTAGTNPAVIPGMSFALASADRSWPYSFLNLCGAFRLSPDSVRAELLETR